VSRERDDHFVLEVIPDKGAPLGKTVRAVSPSDVLYVPDKEELDLLLEHYGTGDLEQMVSDSPFARRWYVEKIRPALRYYCARFSVPPPDWLAQDEEFTEMDEAQMKEIFGVSQLRPREFAPLTSMVGPGDEGGGDAE
jgi:hypothetical protein